MILRMYKTRSAEDPVAEAFLGQMRRHGYDALKRIIIETVLRVEGITADQLVPLVSLFCNDVVEQASSTSMLDPTAGPIREVSYQRAMTDPEMISLMHAALLAGIHDLRWARLSTRYQLVGVDEETADEIITRYQLNKQVQTVIPSGVEWDTLVPQGEAGRVELIDVAHMSSQELVTLSDQRRLHMPLGQLGAMQAFYIREGRLARDAEVEMIAARWSDHCSHTTWKALGLLQRLFRATTALAHPLVLSAFKDNSGVMKFYGGWALNVKGETHISPTFGGSPYGGVATKHGGVIRDVIMTGQGAYPWAGFTMMATCDPQIPWSDVPAGAFHPRTVVCEAVRGTHEYVNPMGIPTGGWAYLVDPRNWKGLALGHSLGVLPESRAQKGVPQAGDLIVRLGEPTGNDGLHGATVSSGKMTAETATVDAAHVQIGMPIGECSIKEVIPVLRDADCIRAGTDCGAAGLSSAVGELGEDTGVWVNLARVPLKCATMHPWQIWLSESQERVVIAVPPEKQGEAFDILRLYGVSASVIGVFTQTGRCQVVFDPEQPLVPPWWNVAAAIREELTVVDLPYSFLNDECPLPEIHIGDYEHLRLPLCEVSPVVNVPGAGGWGEFIAEHLGFYDIADQSTAGHQYDQTVQGNTVVPFLSGVNENMPDELFVATPVPNERCGAAAAFCVSQRWLDISPSEGGALVMAQAFARLVAAGVATNDIVCCANVYTPRVDDEPLNAARLVDLVDGYVNASSILMPIISGKDSSSGTFVTAEGERIDAPLTFCALALGRMPDAGLALRKPFQRAGDRILLFSPGVLTHALGGSIHYARHGFRGTQLPKLNLLEFQEGMTQYYELLHEGVEIRGRSVVGEGGLIRRIFEMVIGSDGLGCFLDLHGRPLEEQLFCEAPMLILAVPREYRGDVMKKLGAACIDIGAVTGQPTIACALDYHATFDIKVETAASLWRNTFAEVIL